MLTITLATNARQRIAAMPFAKATRLLCFGAIGSHTCMWIAAAYTLSAVAKAQAAQASGSMIPQENITISLPVFVVSILATAGFTWAVAQHDRKNDKRIDEATAAVEKRVNAKIDELDATLSKFLRRLGSKDITDT